MFSLTCAYLVYSVALAGLTTFLHACLDTKSILLGKYHYVLYYLVLAMQVKISGFLELMVMISGPFICFDPMYIVVGWLLRTEVVVFSTFGAAADAFDTR